jgi:LPS sulfotransferase NodH
LRKGSFDLEKAKKWFIRYNANYKIWKELFEGPRRPFGTGLIITYEDLLRDTVGFLNNLKNVFGLKLKTKMLISDRMASADIEDKVKFFTEERKRFYLQNGNFSLPNEIVKTITELVDWDLMRFYGYRPKR